MAAIKYSRQRESIIEYLSETKEHPTADMVYTHVRKKYPKISLGTVYRNLNLLVEQGKILKLYCGDGCERFDGCILPHNHFICKKCGRVIDLEMESIDHINNIANVCFNGKIDGHTIYFYGICEDCKNN